MDEVWKEDNNTFCIMPFSHFSPRADGQIKLCSDCLPMIGIPKTGTEDQMVVANEGDSREIPGVKTFNLFAGDSIEDIWNSEFYKDIRRKMLSGKRVTICQQCYLDDERSKHAGIQSKRYSLAYQQKLALDYIDQIKYADNNNGSLGDYRPQRYEMRLSNVCNLACRICSPKASTLIAKEFQNNKKMFPGAPKELIDGRYGPSVPQLNDNEDAINDIISILPQLHFLELHGGEPTIHTGIWKVLNAAIKSGDCKHINVEGHTNILKLTEEQIEILNQFETVKISFSIDAYGEENKYLRHPAEWDVINKQMKLVKQFNNNTVHKRVLSVLNYWNAATIYKLCWWIDEINTEYDLGICHGIDKVSMGLHYRHELTPYELRLEGASKLKEFMQRSNLCDVESPYHAKKFNENIAWWQSRFYYDTIKYLTKDYNIDLLNAELEGKHPNRYDIKKLAGITRALDKIRGTNYREVFPHMPEFET